MTGQTPAGPAESLACFSRQHKAITDHPREHVWVTVQGPPLLFQSHKQTQTAQSSCHLPVAMGSL